jgi:hypothetical protein
MPDRKTETAMESDKIPCFLDFAASRDTGTALQAWLGCSFQRNFSIVVAKYNSR